MIHQYKNNGYNIVMDVCSGSVHVVDDVVYDAVAMYGQRSAAEIQAALSPVYGEEEAALALKEIEELISQEMLFTEDTYEEYVADFKKRQTVVKALCLHVAHDCNLACRYCFAEEGEYHGRRALMSLEVGKKALDFLIANSGNRVNLEVDFFGGEPLMNWDVVKELVRYGRSREEECHKKFRFTITTNGVLLNDEIMEFCNREMSNVVLSLDGRKEVNDHMRPFRSGKGSYEHIVPKFLEFAKSRRGQYYVRGTFTHENLDFSKDVLHFADLGFDRMSIEPVVAPETEPYAIREEDLPQILSEYDRLAVEYIKRQKEGPGAIFIPAISLWARRNSFWGMWTRGSSIRPCGMNLSSATCTQRKNAGIALPASIAAAGARPTPSISTDRLRIPTRSAARCRKSVLSALL